MREVNNYAKSIPSTFTDNMPKPGSKLLNPTAVKLKALNP